MDAMAAASTLCPSSVPCSRQWRTGVPCKVSVQVPVKGIQRRSNGRSRGVRSEQAPECGSGDQQQPLQRRQVISQALLAMSFTLGLPAAQAGTDVDSGAAFKVYEDATEKFSLMVPQGLGSGSCLLDGRALPARPCILQGKQTQILEIDWNKGEGKASGQRKVTAFFPPTDNFTNVNVVITGLGADYTGLGSFGTADNFGENLVNSLDRSWQKPPGQKARLIDARSKAGKYYVEYTLQRIGEKQRHLVSVVGIGNNGWINRLYTVTGQYYEDEADKYKSNVEKVISSFKIV